MSVQRHERVEKVSFPDTDALPPRPRLELPSSSIRPLGRVLFCFRFTSRSPAVRTSTGGDIVSTIIGNCDTDISNLSDGDQRMQIKSIIASAEYYRCK